MGKKVSVRQIVDYLEEISADYEIYGNLDETIEGFSSLTSYKENTITWLKKDNIKIPPAISVCVVQQGIEVEACVRIVCPNSKEVFFSIIKNFWGNVNKENSHIGEGTVIGENVQIGEHVYIGCNCSIKGEIRIGDYTTIGDNVVIRNKVTIGNRCNIQSLTVIGEDGYGYFEDEYHVKTMIEHFGGVIIGDNVFIGSHTNIARGTIDDTIIERGVKIAPSTHIGHNNHIGENSAIVCSKLFGSVEIGENSYIVSSVIRNQVRIGNNVIVGMGSVVTKDVTDNKVLFGAPAKIIRENSGKEKL